MKSLLRKILAKNSPDLKSFEKSIFLEPYEKYNDLVFSHRNLLEKFGLRIFYDPGGAHNGFSYNEFEIWWDDKTDFEAIKKFVSV